MGFFKCFFNVFVKIIIMLSAVVERATRVWRPPFLDMVATGSSLGLLTFAARL